MDQNNEVQTEYYDPVAILLSSVNCNTENLTDELRKCGIKYNQLSGLVEEDLQLMGMTNQHAIKEILSELSSLSNQHRLYDRVLETDFVPTVYAETVIKNTSDHLKSMASMITLMHLKLQAFIPRNVLLDDRFYASELSLQMCQKINAKIGDIQCTINDETKRTRTSSYKSNIVVGVIVLSGVIMFALSRRRI